MKLIIILGPFRAPTPWETECNIRIAETAALEVWRLGCAALCPHTNTRFFQDAAPDEVWLEGGREMLSRCDAAMLVGKWKDSSGTLAEIKHAEEHGIPVFNGINELKLALENKVL